jgi:hypothetical protein
MCTVQYNGAGKRRAIILLPLSPATRGKKRVNEWERKVLSTLNISSHHPLTL